MGNSTKTLSNINGIITTTGTYINRSDTSTNTSWNNSTLSETQLFASHLNNNPLMKEGFKAVFSGFIREEFVKQTESGKEITNEDLRNIADKAAENFTEYLCKL